MGRMTIYLNGTNLTQNYGLVPLKDERSAILKWPKAKDYVTNKNGASNGMDVASTTPFVESSTLSLELGLFADSADQYYTRYLALKTLFLASSTHTLKLENEDFRVQTTVCYEDMTSLVDWNGEWGKFVLRFTEPDPSTRTEKVLSGSSSSDE